ncbi:unnamed protein product [Amoebophrya sp. A25]|nr:unnamed protein product [Amoebophrya sp. A25]|eukprot:GSA25T00009626001.1
MAEGRKTKMQTWIDYRVRVTTTDRRVLVGNFLAFDKYEEFRKLKAKGSSTEEREVKRVIGLIILRGDCVQSMTAEAPPAYAAKTQMQGGPGKAAPAGRGAGSAVQQRGAGLTGPVRGVGGPAAAQMAPRGANRPPGMPA